MARRKRLPGPIDVEIVGIGDGGVGLGTYEEHQLLVRGAPLGAVVSVMPFKRKKGVWHARRVGMVRPAADAVKPRCRIFGLCGGCVLQEMPLERQASAREHLASQRVGSLEGVVQHPMVRAPKGYAYRNRVELTFGATRYLTEEDLAAGLPLDGRFLGFHPPGRFDRIADAPRCELVSEDVNALIRIVREHLLRSSFEPWNPREHTGFWRHLMLRETSLGERLVVIFTAPPPEGAAQELEELAAAIPDVTGVVWMVNERTADAAIGREEAVLRGRSWIEEQVLDVRFRLSVRSFFQTTSEGAERLYRVVREAAGSGRRLIDLYSGVGSIGLCLADRFEEVFGVEIVEDAVVDAKKNAERNGITNSDFIAAPVETVTEGLGGDVLIVDPPRAGLHPKAARFIAGLTADRLVYVACNPRSLGRDRVVLEEGGWKMTDLWTVDLFPQTGHVEAVARFERTPTSAS